MTRTTITFDQLVEHLRAERGEKELHGPNRMPWWGSIPGLPMAEGCTTSVTHHNDDCYLVCGPAMPYDVTKPHGGQAFTRNDVLVIEDGKVRIVPNKPLQIK